MNIEYLEISCQIFNQLFSENMLRDYCQSTTSGFTGGSNSSRFSARNSSCSGSIHSQCTDYVWFLVNGFNSLSRRNDVLELKVLVGPLCLHHLNILPDRDMLHLKKSPSVFTSLLGFVLFQIFGFSLCTPSVIMAQDSFSSFFFVNLLVADIT